MNAEQKEKIRKTAEKILNDHYKGAVGIDLVIVIPDVDMDDNDLAQIIVVFDQDDPNLMGGVAKLNLTTQLFDYMGDLGLDHFPVTYFIGKSEWPEYKKGLDRAIAYPQPAQPIRNQTRHAIIPKANAAAMTAEQKEKIRKTAEKILKKHYDGIVGIDLVTVIPDVDMDDNDFARIIVVFDQDDPNLMGGVAKSNLTTQLSDYMGDLGLDHFPVTYFIGKSEWPKYKKGLDRAFAYPH